MGILTVLLQSARIYWVFYLYCLDWLLTKAL